MRIPTSPLLLLRCGGYKGEWEFLSLSLSFLLIGIDGVKSKWEYFPLPLSFSGMEREIGELGFSLYPYLSLMWRRRRASGSSSLPPSVSFS